MKVISQQNLNFDELDFLPRYVTYASGLIMFAILTGNIGEPLIYCFLWCICQEYELI